MSEVRKPGPNRKTLWIVLILSGAIGIVGLEIVWTKPVREAVKTYTELIAAANRRDIEAAKAVCTDRYLAKYPPKLARDGGMIGLPRNIHKNFQAWQEGEEVWLCPTNRVGPVFRFIKDAGRWKFDGVVGQLMPGGRVEPVEESEIVDSK